MGKEQKQRLTFSRPVKVSMGIATGIAGVALAFAVYSPRSQEKDEQIITYGDQVPTTDGYKEYPKNTESKKLFEQYQTMEQYAAVLAQKAMVPLNPSAVPITYDKENRKIIKLDIDQIIDEKRVSVKVSFRNNYGEGIAEPFDALVCMELPKHNIIFEEHMYNYGDGPKRELYAGMVLKNHGCNDLSELILGQGDEQEEADKSYVVIVFSDGNSLAEGRRTDAYTPIHSMNNEGKIRVERCKEGYTSKAAEEGAIDSENHPIHQYCLLDQAYESPLVALMKDLIRFEEKHLIPTLQRIEAHDNHTTQ